MARNKENDWFKKKWKGVPITPLNIDEHMSDIYKKTKGQYVTQGVSFNKDDAFQMGLLRQAILTHGTFSSFMKHLMHTYFVQQQQIAQMQQQAVMSASQSSLSMSNHPLLHQQQSFSWIPDESLKSNNVKEEEEVVEEEVVEEVVEEEEVVEVVEEVDEKEEVFEVDNNNLDSQKPSVDTTTTGITTKVTINSSRRNPPKRRGGKNPFLEPND